MKVWLVQNKATKKYLVIEHPPEQNGHIPLPGPMLKVPDGYEVLDILDVQPPAFLSTLPKAEPQNKESFKELKNFNLHEITDAKLRDTQQKAGH
jgi:hypothetical protein